MTLFSKVNAYGGGHTINLNITENHKNAGLFAGIGGGFGTTPSSAVWFENAGTVQNLKLTSVITISGDSAYSAGAVAASIADAGSSIKGIASSVTVTVSGSSAVFAGGIVGSANSGHTQPLVIENCYSTGNVSITNPLSRVEAGGIAGSLSTATISSCWVLGTVTASAYSGGIPGYSGGIFGSSSTTSTVSNCVALSPAVSGDNPMNLGGTYLGGTFRIGSADGTLANNHANSAMTVNGSTVPDNTPNGGNGGAVTLAATEAENWWKTTANWSSKFGTSEAAPWKWDSNRKRPVLWFE